MKKAPADGSVSVELAVAAVERDADLGRVGCSV